LLRAQHARHPGRERSGAYRAENLPSREIHWNLLL
jgi:hypothetical protein